MYKVQEVAKIAGVSVRTLHHYDSIGLLKPSNIGANRYRYYNGEDLKLLQQILFLKELGFPLKKIQEVVAHGFDSNFALTQHIELLRQKKARLEQLIENAEQTLLENAGALSLTNEERFAAFSIKNSADNINLYKVEIPELTQEEPITQEAAETKEPELVEALVQATASASETAGGPSFTAEDPAEAAVYEEAPAAEEKPEKEEEDLEEINREGNRIYSAVASLMHLPADNADVQVEMQAYYTLLNRFYDCTPRMFRGLADLYASDQRFANNIDQHGKGLSQYLKEAMYIYAAGLQDA
ncbi:MerR family transcriptional regulator [Planococcus sp. FY231025]|uniref:MerR family transcriptional regulator n=1 Tax=Planococcus sp. FY231025 TaxID=3455699 RepID=UPI003F8EC314